MTVLARRWLRGKQPSDMRHYVGRVFEVLGSKKTYGLTMKLWQADQPEADMSADDYLYASLRFPGARTKGSYFIMGPYKSTSDSDVPVADVTKTGMFWCGTPFHMWTWKDEDGERVHLKSTDRRR